MQQPDQAELQDSSSLLAPIPPSKRVDLVFNISAHVPVLVQATASSAAPDVESPKEQQPKERQILYDAEGAVDPGELLALMGPSGSGKSSLLSALGGRSAARISGTISFNGQPLNKAMQRKLGYVTQDDVLYGELTTFETLYYAALLRLPRSWSREAKLERVDMVLRGLGLEKARDTIIGNHMMRGVSGGERKRVSIGHELLINPSVIFLDEPTSGLDSTTALKLVHTLRSLASGGRTIIASIHQPSSRLFQEFDKLMLLSEARVLYYGHAQAAAQWLAMHGAPVPFQVSTPDHLLDVACADLPGHTREQSEQLRTSLVEAYRTRTAGRGRHGIQLSDVYGHGADAHVDVVGGSKQAAVAADASDSSAASKKVASQPNLHSMLEVESVSTSTNGHGSVKGEQESAGPDTELGATWFQQVQVLTSRAVRTRRFEAFSWQRIAQVLVPAILGGLFWFQIGGKDSLLSKDNVIDLSGLLIFEIMFISWTYCLAALVVFFGDQHILIKERKSGMYRLSAAYVARSISDVPMDCLLPTLFVIALYFFSGLRVTAGAFFANWATVILCVLVAQSAGMLIGAAVSDIRTSMAVATIFMLVAVLVSGFFVKHSPVWIKWSKYLSFIYYGYSMLLKIENSHRGYSCSDYYTDHPDAPPGRTWCAIADGNFLSVNVNASVGRDVGVLIAFLVFFKTFTYFVLMKKTTFKQKME